MKYFKILLVLTSICLFSSGVVKGQSLSWKNIYVEGGISNNTLVFKTPHSITSADCNCTDYRSDIKIQPNGGIGYRYSLNERIKLEPFIGYKKMGSSTTEEKARYNSIINSIQGSLRGIYTVRKIEVGTFISYNRHIQVGSEIYVQEEGQWSKLRDYDDLYASIILSKNYSISGGFIFRYKILNNLYLALNSSTTLTNIFDRDNPEIIAEGVLPNFIKNYQMGIDVVYSF